MAYLPIFLLILSLLFFYGLAPTIRKHPGVFYIISTVLACLSTWYMMALGHPHNLSFWQKIFHVAMGRGALGTMILVLVMYIGALSKNNPLRKRLMPIRAEMAIIGSLFVFAHNIAYGRHFFLGLFSNFSHFPAYITAASILSLLAILLLIPLFITSFQAVRKHMNPKSWKKLQRLAYPYYYLVYFHIMVLYLFGYLRFLEKGGHGHPEVKIVGMIIYTVIYLSYTFLKIKKDRFGLKS